MPVISRRKVILGLILSLLIVIQLLTNSYNVSSVNHSLLHKTQHSLTKAVNDSTQTPHHQHTHTTLKQTPIRDVRRQRSHTETLLTQTTRHQGYDAQKQMRIRADNVIHRCHHNSSVSLRQHDNKEIQAAIFLVSHSGYEFLYKPIPKIGWTTWIYLLFEHGGMLRNVGKTIGRTQWHNPWERLVSGYKNKALEGGFTYIFKRPCEWLTRKMPKLTFKQFVTCILDRAKKPGKPLYSSEAAMELNVHWMPLFTLSVPCLVNYTLIADFEYFHNDTTEALRIFKFNATLTHRNPSKQDKSLSEWYDELDISMINDLKELYKNDFEVFAYDSTPPNFGRLKSNNTDSLAHPS